MLKTTLCALVRAHSMFYARVCVSSPCVSVPKHAAFAVFGIPSLPILCLPYCPLCLCLLCVCVRAGVCAEVVLSARVMGSFVMCVPNLPSSVCTNCMRCVLNCGQLVSFPLNENLGVPALCVFYFLKCFSVSLAQAPPLLELPLVQVCEPSVCECICVRPPCLPAVSVRVACRACVRSRSRG